MVSTNNNNTLYLQGGRVRTSPGQTANTWTNALLSLDLSSEWNIGSPAISQLVADNSGGNSAGSPPAVQLGWLWPSADGQSLFQYGGAFSDTPAVSPAGAPLWQYTIASRQWQAVSTPGTSVVRSAEGAGAIVPADAGAGGQYGYYFGGHLDAFSVNGWSIQTPRIYLSSMVRLDLDKREWYNYTSYSTDAASGTDNSVTEAFPIFRADFTLTFVPKIGTDNKGLLVAIGGGNDERMIDNTVLDVFDIGAGGWTKQATTGSIPPPRVNHCAVRASASVNGDIRHQIFIYGGQNANQTEQYGDIYILDIPSYTWTSVGASLPGAPTPRAGHTCDIVGSQMVVVGGYVTDSILCDQPGIYVYDVSNSAWSTKYNPDTTYRTPAVVAAITGGRGDADEDGTTGTHIPDGTGWGRTGEGRGSSGTQGNGGGSGNDQAGSTNSSGGGGGTPVGAIVGGVIGGLVGLGLLGALLFFCGRRSGYRDRRASLRPFLAKMSNSHGRNSSSASNASGVGAASDMRHSGFAHAYDSQAAGSAPVLVGTAAAHDSASGSDHAHSGGHHSPAQSFSQGYQYVGGSPGQEMSQVGGGVRSSRDWSAWHPASDDPETETRDMEAVAGTHFVPRRALRVVNQDDGGV